MSAEQKTLHRGFTIITVLERLSKGRARLSVKVLASDEDHKRRLGGKKLLQAKRWFDQFADDLAAPVIAGLKHTIDLELAAAEKAAPKASAKPAAKTAKPAKAVKALKEVKEAKSERSGKADKPDNVVKPGKTVKVAAETKLARTPKVGNGAPAAVGSVNGNGVVSAAAARKARPVVAGRGAAKARTAAPAPVRRIKTASGSVT